MNYLLNERFMVWKAWTLVLLLLSPVVTLGSQENDRALARENLGSIFSAQLVDSSRAEQLAEIGFQAEDINGAARMAGYLVADCFISLFDNFNGSERDYLFNVSIVMTSARSFFSRLELLSKQYGSGGGELDHQVLLAALDAFRVCGSASMNAAGFPVEDLTDHDESCAENE